MPNKPKRVVCSASLVENEPGSDDRYSVVFDTHGDCSRLTARPLDVGDSIPVMFARTSFGTIMYVSNTQMDPTP